VLVRPVAHPAGPRTSIRWFILALLIAASFVAYVLRTNMSVAGESMITDLGLSRFQLGMVLAAFAWGYSIFQFPGGVLGDLIGSRRALTMIAILWGMLNLLVGLVPGRSVASPIVILGWLIALRFLMGAAQAPLYPVTGGGTTANWFPVSGWAFPNGLTNAGLTLGSAATGPLIAWLIERLGWRQSFVLTAPLGFLLAAVWWWYARDTPAEHSAVSQAELELIDAGRPAAASEPAGHGAWKLVLRDREVLLLTASYFCSNYVFYFFFNWLFIYLIESRHFRILEGGFYAAAPWIAGAVGALIGGLACDGLTRRIGIRWGCRLPAVVGLLLTAVFIVAAARAASPVLAVVCLSLCLAGQQSTEGAYWAATISVSGRHAATGCGVLNTGGNVVGGLGALAVPLIVTALGWPAAVASGAIFAVLAALLWFGIDSGQRLADTA
jgi:ACS family glucarate transporter-like MFS transporter